ncbi:abortive infection system toxin AbiGii family protein [Enterococcus faecalis]|uniref:abortive infection system toxin AbiGii family protein n=1 Tax=Enterococcus faecalis TaxID=1351 RepID=UPI001F53B2FC|nr:abortive infection system toxin AbiGii family protein [Enterococcus faecalis]MCI1171889.1 abortive infection system toxin AbiGii family protein [Enterococcus faecalis]MCT6644687.1 abortive infection system toxin AbiGii family protein [Enterococcus faecalis]
MSFKAAFKEKENLLNVGSEAWKRYINFEAPEGMHYEFDGGSDYLLKSNDGSSLEMNVKIKIPEDLKKAGVRNANDLTKLLYRTQREVEIEVPQFSHKGNPITFSQLKKSFNPNIKEKNGKFYVVPKPFKEPFEIPITINDRQYKFKVKQVPFPSLEEEKYESIEDGIFFITINYNEETSKMHFSLTYNLKKAKSIEEIIENKNLLQDLAEGNVEIVGNKTEILTKEQSTALESLINFYSKLSDIEKELSIQFNPKEIITMEDVLNTDKAHISLVEDKYYYNDKCSQDTFEITLKDEIDLSSWKNTAMIGYNEVTVTILDQSIQMAEQFVLKCTEPEDSYKKLNKKGESIKFKVKEDKTQYNKLFLDIPDNPDMNEISTKLENAINLNEV